MDKNEIQNNVQNEDAMKEQKKENRKRIKRVVTWTSIATIIIIIILLLLRSCGGGSGVTPGGTGAPDSTSPPIIGDFDITDDQIVNTTEPPVVDKVMPTITFAGYGKYEVSAKTPKVELKNPEKNAELGVNFIFTVMDKKTGDVIARTPQVAPGKYVYVNVVDYYKNPGKYELLIKIDTVNNEGVEMNGIEQKMDLVVK